MHPYHVTHFLPQGGSVTCDGRDDAAEFADIRSAMKVLMMTDQEIWDILKILAALLHMGNIKYKGKVREIWKESSSILKFRTMINSKTVFSFMYTFFY